jgi:hypothetical protein
MHVLFEGTINTLTLNPKTEHASQHIGVRDESSSKTLVHLLHLSTGAGRPVLTDLSLSMMVLVAESIGVKATIIIHNTIQ